MIYFDNAATTSVGGTVLHEMLPYFTEDYGNPESVHQAADKPAKAIREAEERVHKMLHTNGSGKVVFTSGGTESNNMVFQLCKSYRPFAMNIVTSATEHKSVLEPADSCKNAVIHLIKPGKKGFISADDLDMMCVPDFSVISFMHMNNETGMVNEVYRIGEKLRKCSDLDIFYHVDCVQSAGELPIDVLEMNADMVSISSHKLHGPKGVGCMWVSDRLLNRIDPQTLTLIYGGGQQGGLRAGTMNVTGIVGLGKACLLAGDGTVAREVISAVSKHFVESLTRFCKDASIKFKVNFCKSDHHDDKVLSITFPEADSETVVMVASKNGLCISNGAACNSVSSEPSYVLLNSGIKPDLARNTVRVSFSRYNTYTEAEHGAEILCEAVKEVLSLTGISSSDIMRSDEIERQTP